MKKRTWVIITIVLLLVLFLGIGAKAHMDKINTQKKLQYSEEIIAKNIIAEYSGIEKVEFKGNTLNSETGFIQTLLSVNDSQTFGYDSNFDNPKDGTYADSYEFFEKTPLKNGNKRKQKLHLKDIDLNKYKIIYYLKIDE
ncbi:hypothetical protein GNF18_07715 [Ligilactobacillus pobuzihii]|uniref:hypothetical protein n=1 Tax=Ligilactobacillus pobuzihii TaxID=449659 RepID=UPI0019D1D944|nr:hypothetical protein [Ligilactobacillus pobuzihii]MBN7275021.1 hypothetical protein [Ligilactobacillus pobuzihii]